MLAKVISSSVHGIDADIVQVEVDSSNGIPSFTMTGYLGDRVREAGDRVRTAIKNVGYKIPSSRIVVNVSPASIRKSGTMLDLPVAVGILTNLGVIANEQLEGVMIAGELSLDGNINNICGILPMVHEAYRQGIERVIIPYGNVGEARMISEINVVGVRNLREVIGVLNGELPEESEFMGNNVSEVSQITERKTKRQLFEQGEAAKQNSRTQLDFSDVCGQFAAKRAITIAAAGRHNLMMSGPPGSGKTLLASRIPTILPELTREEIIEVSKIYSVAGMLDNVPGCISMRPFRSPHHTITQSALIGGGQFPIPGEITLAHEGVLFLDELTKFKTSVLESLRQPMEEHYIKIMRNNIVCRFPANFMLVAAMNPCKCGFYPDRNLCNCTELDIMRHVGRLSRPFLDRFDLSVHVERPDYEEIAINPLRQEIHKLVSEGSTYNANRQISSKEMAKQVLRAVEIQKKRYKNLPIKYNSELSMAQIKKFCQLDEKSDELMKEAYERYNLSARGYGKILKVARTIADLEALEKIHVGHLSEAICFRNLEGTTYGNG